MFQTISFIINHPLNKGNKLNALFQFLKWQFRSRLINKPYIHKFTENSKLLVKKGMTGATGNIYCGLHEFEDMSFLLHFLRPDDLFVDIGANIGSYSILASGEIGAKTISIEPIPATFESLKTNIYINEIKHLVEALNIGLGSASGTLKFTKSLDTVNHIATDQEDDTIDVKVDTLDNVLGDKSPSLLKIDVEGFETEVLKGAEKTLINPNLKAIIIELNGSGQRYGYDEQSIHNNLLNKGFSPYTYNPFTRQIVRIEQFGTHNTIYLSDLDFVQGRLRTAKEIHIFDKKF